MFSNILNSLASATPEHKKLMQEVVEFRALKVEINKARCGIEFDAKGTITSINENTLKALQYAESELLAQHHSTLISRVESTSAEYVSFWESLAKGITQSGSFKLQNKAGKTVWFQGYYAPLLDNTGKLLKIVSYLTDTTAINNNLESLQSEDDALLQSFGIVECASDGTILECNELFYKPLGYVKADLVGKNITTVLTREDAESETYKAMWVALANGERQAKQVKRVAKDGHEYWFQASYTPVKDVEGKLSKVMVYSSCITAEKLKNADYEGQLAALSRIQAVAEFDLKGNILKVNENFTKAVGYAESEIIGKHHSMFVDAAQKSSAEYQAFWEKLASGKAEANVYKRVAKDGKEIWMQANYNPILDLHGKPFKVVKYATDVTKYKMIDADNEGQLTAIKKIQGVIEFDMTGKVTRVNANFANVTGYSEAEIVGNHHSMFVDSAFKASHEYKAFWEKLARGEADTGQYKRVGKGGKEVWLQASYNPILDMNGKPFKVVKFATDITDQHAAAASLESAVQETQAIIESAKAGDLSSRVSLDGKTGAIASLCDGVNALMDKMTEVIAQVREAGETINTAATEIASGNNDLSSRTEQQASSLEETASSMEELASTVKQNAENAKQANQLAAAASGVAVKGGQVVGNVVTTMADINSSARKIEDIISEIDGIAFQTNILALNAAVEAARAGEQGRGFAVVAGEVRNLAQRSASAAKEIKELISDSVGKVQVGTKLVEDAGNTMQEIVSSVQRVTDIMGEISAASSEQSTGIDQVNNAITSMDEVTQQNAALVEQAAAAAESLVEQAASLMDTVGAFKLAGGSQYSNQSKVSRLKPPSGGNSERRSNSSPMRVSAPLAAKPTASKPATKVIAKTGTDDGEWEEF